MFKVSIYRYENFQEDIPDEEEDNQEDDLGFDIF